MPDAPHSGVAEADPRNRGIVERFRPPEVTRDYVHARLAGAFPRETPAQIEARVAAFMTGIASRPTRAPAPLSQAVDQAADPLNGLGTHPDLIDQLWRLDRALPHSCRWLVWGYPALVHPRTGVIFAVAFGTIGIVVRLPPELRDQAPAVRVGNPGQQYDISTAGAEWRFLVQVKQASLCRAAYEFADRR